MYGIFLTEIDKVVLAKVEEDGMTDQDTPLKTLIPTLEYLKSVGLVEIKMYQGEFRTARLTSFGKKFKLENPKLKSEMTEYRKWLITTVIAVLAAIGALIANLRV